MPSTDQSWIRQVGCKPSNQRPDKIGSTRQSQRGLILGGRRRDRRNRQREAIGSGHARL